MLTQIGVLESSHSGEQVRADAGDKTETSAVEVTGTTRLPEQLGSLDPSGNMGPKIADRCVCCFCS